MWFFGSYVRVSVVINVNIIVEVGSMLCMKVKNGRCVFCYSNRFCGLLIGFRVELVFIVSVLSIIIGSMGRFDMLLIVIVSGISRNRFMLLVSIIDSIVVFVISSRFRVCSECVCVISVLVVCCIRLLLWMFWMVIIRFIKLVSVGNCS